MIKTNEINFEYLLNNIEVEKKDCQPLKESEIQSLVIKYIDNKDLDSHPSLSGIKAKSFGQIKFIKNQGIKKGHPDLIIEEPAGKYQMLYLELKTVKGKLSKEQEEWIKRHLAKGHACSVSYGYYDAVYKIEKYLQGKPILYSKNTDKEA